MSEATKDYLVWSNEHSAWWGPNRSGYYTMMESAGRYSRDEALKICVNARGGRRYNENPSEVPILLSDAEVFWPDESEEDRREKGRIRQRQIEEQDAFYSDYA